MTSEDYKELIKKIEEKRNKIIHNKTISKKFKNIYLDKYNTLLLDLYTKYISNTIDK